jgi:hypothetical protein
MTETKLLDKMGDELIKLHNNLSAIVKTYMDHLNQLKLNSIVKVKIQSKL